MDQIIERTRRFLDHLDLPAAINTIAAVEDSGIKEELQNRFDCLSDRVCDVDTLRLHTLMKSGTNYFRIYLANYLALLEDASCNAVTYDDLDVILPRNSYMVFPQGNPYLRSTKFKHFVYFHGAFRIGDGSPHVITLHRNALDFVVSYYYYRFKSRGDARFATIGESVRSSAGAFANTLRGWMTCETRSRHLALQYEDLVTNPIDVMRSVVDYVGLIRNEYYLALAAERSSFKTVRAFEELNGSIHGATGQFFTRSGKIGQWEAELTPADVDLVARTIQRFGVKFVDDSYMNVELVKVDEGEKPGEVIPSQNGAY